MTRGKWRREKEGGKGRRPGAKPRESERPAGAARGGASGAAAARRPPPAEGARRGARHLFCPFIYLFTLRSPGNPNRESVGRTATGTTDLNPPSCKLEPSASLPNLPVLGGPSSLAPLVTELDTSPHFINALPVLLSPASAMSSHPPGAPLLCPAPLSTMAGGLQQERPQRAHPFLSLTVHRCFPCNRARESAVQRAYSVEVKRSAQ